MQVNESPSNISIEVIRVVRDIVRGLGLELFRQRQTNKNKSLKSEGLLWNPASHRCCYSHSPERMHSWGGWQLSSLQTLWQRHGVSRMSGHMFKCRVPSVAHLMVHETLPRPGFSSLHSTVWTLSVNGDVMGSPGEHWGANTPSSKGLLDLPIRMLGIPWLVNTFFCIKTTAPWQRLKSKIQNCKHNCILILS